MRIHIFKKCKIKKIKMLTTLLNNILKNCISLSRNILILDSERNKGAMIYNNVYYISFLTFSVSKFLTKILDLIGTHCVSIFW